MRSVAQCSKGIHRGSTLRPQTQEANHLAVLSYNAGIGHIVGVLDRPESGMFRVFLQQQSRSDTKKEALEAVTIVETPASHCCRRAEILQEPVPLKEKDLRPVRQEAKSFASSHTQIRKTDLSQKTAHHRTELNKKIYRIGLASDDANALTESDGSIPGTRKRVITIRKSLMVHTSRRDLEKVQLKFHRHIVEHGAFQTFEEKATFLDVLKPPPRGAIKHLCYLTVVFGVVLCATSIIRSPADSELAKRGCSSSSLATMGIPDYWKLVNAASETISLKLLAAKGGTPGSSQLYLTLSDSLWITQCQAVFHKPRHAQMGRNPELRALFYKAAALNAAGAEGGPLEKRGKRVKAKPHWLIEELQEMVKKMGFHVHQAPGEAEAKLARLNYIGWIDAVLTDDGDAALFGATCIIRSLDKKNRDSVTIYASTALASHPSVQLTRGGIFLLAVMHGGDYDTIGLPKCGMGLAHGLARCGFGDALLGATQTMNDADLSQFLVGWREAVREELATNARGYLKSKHNTPFLPPNPDEWVVKLPALPELGLFVKSKFGWKPTDIVDKFRRLIFPGLCVRRLNLRFDLDHHLHQHIVLGRINDEHLGLSSFLSILARREMQPGLIMYQLKVAVNILTRQVLLRLGAPASAAGSSSATITQWFSRQAVERYFPVMVQRFNNNILPSTVEFLRPICPSSIPSAEVPPPQPHGRHVGFVDLTLDDNDNADVTPGPAAMEVDIIDLT
ncbi:hypothetical protein R3P38DRAFT_3182785 [Favolaschia claudopus]|uniref:XPG-I domain-containing protein n=1 Tax=Favolaschia claudopus TaxID=2862362 RepID=A0AAW0CCA8_9AGAR